MSVIKKQEPSTTPYRRNIDREKLKVLDDQKLQSKLKSIKDKIATKRKRYDEQRKLNEIRLKSYMEYASIMEQTINSIQRERKITPKK
jgi:hypothetical protein